MQGRSVWQMGMPSEGYRFETSTADNSQQDTDECVSSEQGFREECDSIYFHIFIGPVSCWVKYSIPSITISLSGSLAFTLQVSYTMPFLTLYPLWPQFLVGLPLSCFNSIIKNIPILELTELCKNCQGIKALWKQTFFFSLECSQRPEEHLTICGAKGTSVCRMNEFHIYFPVLLSSRSSRKRTLQNQENKWNGKREY